MRSGLRTRLLGVTVGLGSVSAIALYGFGRMVPACYSTGLFSLCRETTLATFALSGVAIAVAFIAAGRTRN